jgi:hypothetical protein
MQRNPSEPCIAGSIQNLFTLHIDLLSEHMKSCNLFCIESTEFRSLFLQYHDIDARYSSLPSGPEDSYFLTRCKLQQYLSRFIADSISLSLIFFFGLMRVFHGLHPRFVFAFTRNGLMVQRSIAFVRWRPFRCGQFAARALLFVLSPVLIPQPLAKQEKWKISMNLLRYGFSKDTCVCSTTESLMAGTRLE